MSLEDILPLKLHQTPLVTCASSHSIHQVVRLMSKHNVGSVVILENGYPIGIVTDRDVAVRALAKEPAVSLADPVRVIMSSPVKTVRSHQGIQDAIKIMKQSKVRRLPVINDAGSAVGIITFADLYTLLTHAMNDLRFIVAPKAGFEFGKLVA
ncbi:MAG: CBS domain-containing protein [Proteobacteria bacterium]|nr:CBS domain-containing protein [Pseudomonadota bacterium]NDD03697.1 CBS domain-containing protein [Pseudomonadota bacterium]